MAFASLLTPNASPGSAAAHGDDDFQLVAVRQAGFGVLAARYDLAVALDCQALAGQVQVRQKLGKGGSGLEGMGFPVDGETDDIQVPAFKILAKSVECAFYHRAGVVQW